MTWRLVQPSTSLKYRIPLSNRVPAMRPARQRRWKAPVLVTSIAIFLLYQFIQSGTSTDFRKTTEAGIARKGKAAQDGANAAQAKADMEAIMRKQADIAAADNPAEAAAAMAEQMARIEETTSHDVEAGSRKYDDPMYDEVPVAGRITMKKPKYPADTEAKPDEQQAQGSSNTDSQEADPVAQTARDELERILRKGPSTSLVFCA